MLTARTAKIAALTHVGLVLAAVYYVTRIANFTPLTEMPSKDMIAFSAMAIPPLLAAWIGAPFARGAAASRLLALGLLAALAVFALTFAGVLSSDEPLAPLLLLLVSLWLAAGLAVLLLVVWLVGRRAPAGA